MIAAVNRPTSIIVSNNAHVCCYPPVVLHLSGACAVQVQLVIVTGAGPQISLLLRQAAIKEEFHDGLRVTSQESLKVVYSFVLL